mgnify:CR=1 FL=1
MFVFPCFYFVYIRYDIKDSRVKFASSLGTWKSWTTLNFFRALKILETLNFFRALKSWKHWIFWEPWKSVIFSNSWKSWDTLEFLRNSRKTLDLFFTALENLDFFRGIKILETLKFYQCLENLGNPSNVFSALEILECSKSWSWQNCTICFHSHMKSTPLIFKKYRCWPNFFRITETIPLVGDKISHWEPRRRCALLNESIQVKIFKN